MRENPTEQHKGSATPARLDFMQSLSGLLLGLFMLGHLSFLSAILISEDFAYWVDKNLEGAFLSETGHGYPVLVTIVAALVFGLFVLHALLAMRKFPHDWKQYRAIQKQMQAMHHEDTTHWFWQVYTGFVLFFLGSAHVLFMMTNPDQIGPYATADRMYGDYMWIFYSILLVAFVVHGVVGLYRLANKWGWFEFGHAKDSRRILRKVKKILGAILILMGAATIYTYTMLGHEHRDRAGERYVPTHERQSGEITPTENNE